MAWNLPKISNKNKYKVQASMKILSKADEYGKCLKDYDLRSGQ